MTEQAFSLIPFPAPNIPEVTVAGWLRYEDRVVNLHYSLVGNMEEISLPDPSVPPRRRDELWKGTCFEFFLAIKDRPQYWEFNMSPSGDWNVYRMDAYRRISFRAETWIQRLQIEVQKRTGALMLEAAVDVSPLIQKSEPLELGITAVLQTKEGNESYWALAHPASHPDFHRRESFTLRPAAQSHPSEQSAPGD